MAYPATVDSFKTAVNNLTLSMAAAFTIGDLVLWHTGAAGAPAAGSFHIGTDIFTYTSVDGAKFNGILNGQDGTTPQNHLPVAGGNEIVFGPEASHHNDHNTAIIAIETTLGTTAAPNFVKNTGNETVAGVKTFSSSPVVPTPTTDMQASTKKYADDLKITLKSSHMLCIASGFILDGSAAVLTSAVGTANEPHTEHITALKTQWFDFPSIIIPTEYDGGDIVITVGYKCAAASKKHSLGIRVASSGSGDEDNPTLAAAYQLYNEQVSDATPYDITIKSVTVIQANHLMVAGEVWFCKFVVEDDAGCNADAVLIDFVDIKWNKA